MTKRPILLSAVLLLTLGTVACSNDESKAATGTTETSATTVATSTTEAPALPDDVANVTGAVASETTGTAETTTAPANGFTATGEFVSPMRSELSPKMPGRVARLYVQEGAHVHRGQALLDLESDYARINLQSAEAQVAQAKAARDEAARDLERKKGLSAKDSIPKATLDRSQAMYDQASAALAGASAQASLLRQQIADSTLRSPVEGIVAEKRTDVGARLGEAGVAFVVVQLSPLKLRFAVPERFLGRIKPGDKVTARVDPYPNEAFEGTIKTLGGVIDPKTRTMFAEAEFGNRDGRLRPGLFARVETKLD
jgi:membrane fusion protein (multidrug efflux system)